MTYKKNKIGLVAVLLAVVFGAIGFTGCKTSEKNYRKAYERAVADNDRGVTEFENTIYNKYRGRMQDAQMVLGTDTIDTKVLRVKVTKDGGGIREWLKKYSVVVGEFKQLFNANSLRQRFVDAGYPRTFLVENNEPYYYIVVDSSDDLRAMDALADSVAKTTKIPLKDGFPYILQSPIY